MTKTPAEIAAALQHIAEKVAVPPIDTIRRLQEERRRRKRFATVSIAVVMALGATLALGQFNNRDSVTVATAETPSSASDEIPASSRPASTELLDPDPPDTTPAIITPAASSTSTLPKSISELGTTAERPTSLVFVSGRRDVILSEGDDRGVVFRYNSESDEAAPSYVESIAAASPDSLMVGICCEPAAGLTLLVDLETGTARRLPLDGSYPSIDPSGADLTTTDGYAVRLNQFSAVIASEPYESTFLFEGLQGQVPRPEWVDSNSIAIALSEQVLLIPTNGSTAISTELAASQVVFDAYNGVLLAVERHDEGAVGSSLAVLDKHSLERVDTIELPNVLEHLDVHDGWLLMTTREGALLVSPITEPAARVVAIESDGVSTAAWVVSQG